MSTTIRSRVVVAAIVAAAVAPVALAEDPDSAADPVRDDAIARASVWSATNVAAMNLRTGPTGPGSFTPNEVVDCLYVQREMDGGTPKFTCRLKSGDEVKVKYGRDNGEVYAEVAATRLLWALGFGADHMYPVRVRCRGCPHGEAGDQPTPRNEILMLEAAAIERKMPGEPLDHPDGSGWSWPEIEDTNPARGGASMAERDALKLLAAVLQHTDSKREQQRLLCRGGHTRGQPCRSPLMMISDVGKTFGRANAFNRDAPGSVNLKAWSSAPVWTDHPGCRAHLGRSLTGTLDNPVISEAGRKFLASLLNRLTERQLRDLFTVARFPMRTDTEPGAESQEIDAWVQAFKHKVEQIDGRTCPPGRVS